MRRLLLAIALSFSFAACGETEELIDCADICEDFDDCTGIDRTECIDRCEDQPHSEIDECDACLDSEDLGCVDCAAQCAPLSV